jgi:hypothetical protein
VGTFEKWAADLPLGEVENMATERAAVLSDETGLDVEFEITETASK